MAAHPPRRIVVGVETGGSSDNAVAAAVELARRFEARIELVHAVRPTRFGHEVEPELLEAARRAVRLHLEATLAGALLPYVSEEHHLVVAPGHPAAVLLERAEEPDTGLVVLGAHRRHGLLNLKNAAQNVIMRAQCPVWVQEGPVRDVRRILVPVDLSRESLEALATACRWATTLRAAVVVLHCFVTPELYVGHGAPVPGPTYVVDRLRDDARAEFEGAMERFEWGGVGHRTVFAEESPVTQVVAMQDEVDLVLLGTHGRTGLSALVLGNTAASVLREVHLPVVTLRAPGREWLL